MLKEASQINFFSFRTVPLAPCSRNYYYTHELVEAISIISEATEGFGEAHLLLLKRCYLVVLINISVKLLVMETVEKKIARHSDFGTVTEREIVVQFNSDVVDGMQWKFTPTQREVRVKPGENALAFYTAENKSSAPVIGVSTYYVTPMKAGVYFNKIQCFYFEEQTSPQRTD